ncbi:LOW QUALITY PROTEIN: unconventional myosin-XVIIIb-like [Leuresthes tenuis]|uniref:LOW QUALITY PROTEIN: unconventional myosin-XVIIIb-like n=1 Tax=Leuresthes tenuis TaxID=355514 RepID=UPI003B511A1C
MQCAVCGVLAVPEPGRQASGGRRRRTTRTASRRRVLLQDGFQTVTKRARLVATAPQLHVVAPCVMRAHVSRITASMDPEKTEMTSAAKGLAVAAVLDNGLQTGFNQPAAIITPLHSQFPTQEPFLFCCWPQTQGEPLEKSSSGLSRVGLGLLAVVLECPRTPACSSELRPVPNRSVSLVLTIGLIGPSRIYRLYRISGRFPSCSAYTDGWSIDSTLSHGGITIKEENKPVAATVPPPPLSVLPGGFLKQLVRETEKEIKPKEPEVKEERPPNKLSDNLVQQFLNPDQTPPILEAEMSLRAEQLNNHSEQKRCNAQSDGRSSSQRHIMTPDSDSKPETRKDVTPEPGKSKQQEKQQQEKQQQEKQHKKTPQAEQKKEKKEGMEQRQEPEGKQEDTTIEHDRREVRDVWYEAGTVWYVHKDGFSRATQLKPDEGTPELPEGRVRVRLEADGSLHDVTEYEVEKVNPSELDLCEDLSDLQSVNECGVLHALTSRAKANLPLTRAGPNLVNLWPPSQSHSKTPKSRRGESVWDAPPALAALVKRVYVSMVGTRRDHSVCPLGRSGTGKTTACQAFTHALLKQAGTAGQNISAERLQAMFSILRSFGCVSSPHSDASSRFAMVFSLDFNHAGQVAAGHLQTMMLDKWKVCHQSPGESNFLVFSQMLAGISTEMRTELQLHQLPESNSFGIVHPTKVEEKQRASVAFTKLLTAMETLGFSAGEQKAIWHVLACIYHLGAAGACKVARRQFVNFDSAQVASSVLGCEGEELHTAVFKHHLRQLLQKATGGGRERANDTEEGPRLTATQCVDGMAAGLYEELFTVIVSLINRALSDEQLALASVMVVDTPGLRNPRHAAEERGASWSELCHNYLQERLLEHYHVHTFVHTLDRYAQEKVKVEFECPESSPAEVVSAIDQPPPQIRAADGDPRGLLWVLDEEMVTPASSESGALERVCQYYSNTVRQCEQPLQCEVNHLMGRDPVRYDLTGWFGLIQNNQSALNAICLLQNSTIGAVKALFTPRISLPPLCRGLGGLEGGSQRALQRNGTIRKTFSGGMAAVRRHSQCIAVKLQADALVNLIRRARPVFLQCVSAKTDGGSFDVSALRVQVHATQILSALQLYRTGYPEHMALSDFRCHFQALSPPIMKRYASMFVSHDERKAVEELLVELDVDRKSVAVGASRVFMKRGVLRYLEQQREQQVTGWLVHLQGACMGHLARQKYRKLKVQQMAVRCLQSNLRALRAVTTWSWWKLFCRVRPLLDVNMDNERLRAKEDEISALRRRLEKSEKERNELRQAADSLETKVTAVTSELSDERFRGDAVGQALDVERAERLRLSRENKDLQARLDQCRVTMETLEKQLEEEKLKAQVAESQRGAATDSELAMQLECSQTEVEFVRRRLKQTEEKLETERQTRQQLDSKVAALQAQLEQSRRSATELKRHCRRVTSDLQDARVLTDSLQNRVHELERKQRRFDNELSQALEDADSGREQKEKALLENAALGTEVFNLRRSLQESQAEVSRLHMQKEELCAQIRDLSLPVVLASDSLPDLKKQLRFLESQASERAEEFTKLTSRIQQQQQVHMRFEMEMERMKQMHQKELEDKDEELEDVHKSSQRRLRQLEMQLEQEYEEKQMVIHEKHDLEGLIATLCDQVGHRDFDVEKKLRGDLRRTRALLADAQLLLTTMDSSSQSLPNGSKDQIERLHFQVEESEARRLEAEGVQKTLSQELENAQLELENICKQKSALDEQLTLLQHEKLDLLKRLEEDQEDLNELMKKHKALIAQSSSDISQIRDLQAELEEVKKQRRSLQEELQQSVSRVQFLEASTVGRSIVSKQEARVCDLENKLEFQRGQVKRFEVLVLRLRDSVVRLGEELEQSAQAEAREKDNARYYQQRLQEMRVEMEDLSQREQQSGRRRMELEMQVEELTAVRLTLQADLETSIRRIADLQAALEEVESSDESDTESDSVSSVGSVGTEDVGEGLRNCSGASRAGSRGGGSTFSSQDGRQSVTDTMSTYSFRSCLDPDDEASEAGGVRRLSRAPSSSALSELLDGLRRRRAGADAGDAAGSTVSLPIYQTTGASTLRRRSSALSVGPEDQELRPGPSILKPSSPLLPRAGSSRSITESADKASRDSSLPSLPRLSSLSATPAARHHPPSLSIPEEDPDDPLRPAAAAIQRSPQGPRRCMLGSLLTADGGECSLGSEPMVFKNRRLAGDRDDAASDILPAVRRAQSTSSLAGSVRGGRRALSVHFGELPPSSRSRKSSETESSSSGGSAGSSQGGGPRRRFERPQGKRLEAEGSEGEDVAAVMKKYLKKEID